MVFTSWLFVHCHNIGDCAASNITWPWFVWADITQISDLFGLKIFFIGRWQIQIISCQHHPLSTQCRPTLLCTMSQHYTPQYSLSSHRQYTYNGTANAATTITSFLAPQKSENQWYFFLCICRFYINYPCTTRPIPCQSLGQPPPYNNLSISCVVTITSNTKKNNPSAMGCSTRWE